MLYIIYSYFRPFLSLKPLKNTIISYKTLTINQVLKNFTAFFLLIPFIKSILNLLLNLKKYKILRSTCKKNAVAN